MTLSCLLLLMFAPAVWNLMKIWNGDGDYSHGFLVVPIALFMVWHRREKILATAANPCWFGLPFFVIGAAGYVVSFFAKFHTLTYLSMLLTIVGLVLSVGGYRMTGRMILPILFLAFMFPIPDAYHILITNPLKLTITRVSAVILQTFGIPVYQEGNLLFFAEAKLEVAEACSGIRSLYSYLMLGCLFALVCRRRSQKAVMIASAFPLAIVVNILRVVGTGVLANSYGEEVAQGFFHEFAGITLFLVGIAVLSLEYYILLSRSK